MAAGWPLRAGPAGSPSCSCPPTPPDLNPVQGAWSSMKSSLGNLATCTIDQLAAIIRNRLGRIQRQPALITALLGQTGLTLESQPP